MDRNAINFSFCTSALMFGIIAAMWLNKAMLV